ncbi:hypothetical protein [Streptomyces sp. NBC_00328]|uniref:hypothetical protein n=1 Tax=Streptomyces sp. NBC_00328 TaxID=2903646 RepID=UPI002E2B7A58|nr:hypothetical protein [Streptomyces sp. NBC_00328]
MIFLLEIFVWGAAAARTLVTTWWLAIPALVVLLGLGFSKMRDWRQVVRYEADVKAGRVTPILDQLCDDCRNRGISLTICDACKERLSAA